MVIKEGVLDSLIYSYFFDANWQLFLQKLGADILIPNLYYFDAYITAFIFTKNLNELKNYNKKNSSNFFEILSKIFWNGTSKWILAFL